jgi:hypothetical protein
LMTLADSMPGDLADAMASVLPRLVPFAMLRPRFYLFSRFYLHSSSIQFTVYLLSC